MAQQTIPVSGACRQQLTFGKARTSSIARYAKLGFSASDIPVLSPLLGQRHVVIRYRLGCAC